MTPAAPSRALRVCVIGNSHAGALRRGWEALRPEPDGIRPTFFASPGRSLAHLRQEDGRLVPTLPSVARYLALTSGGPTNIVLADFDAFVLAGLAFLLPRPDRRHSAAVRYATCHDAWSASLSARLVGLIRQASAAPVLVAHNPLPTERSAPARLDPMGYEATLAALQDDIVPPGVQLLPQPAATRTDDWLTRAEFRSGAATLLGEGVPDHDTTHMNARFGELWWGAALDRLAPQGSNT